MKKLLYIFLLATTVLLGCEKTDTEAVYDKAFVQFQTRIDYHSPNYEYEAEFEGITFKIGGDNSVREELPTIPRSLLDARGYVTGDMKVWPIYLGKRQEPVVFNVTLKADTMLRFRQAVGDRLRMLTRPEDEAEYTTMSFMQMNDHPGYSPRVTFNGELMPFFGSIYFRKDNMKGTFRFYRPTGDNINRIGGQFDDKTELPELVVENYTVKENESIPYFKAMGSPIALWHDGDEAKYTTLNARIVYGAEPGVDWAFTYDGDQMSRNYDSYVLKTNLSKTIKIYLTKRSESKKTLVREISGPFTEGQTLEFIVEGDNIFPTTYDGPEPSSRSASFFKFGYNKVIGGNITAKKINMKIFLAQLNVSTGAMSKVSLLKEMRINNDAENGLVYGETLELNATALCPPGMPQPSDNDVMGYLCNYIIEVTDADTGEALTTRTLGFIPYISLNMAGSSPLWPLRLKHKQYNILLNGSNGDISIAYSMGVWPN